MMASNSVIMDKQILDIEECVQTLKREFEESGIPISDDSTAFNRFCVKLEFLLQTEQKEKLNLLGNRKGYWDYFCKCLATKRNIHDGLKFVKSISEFRTSPGRGRAFLRFCLTNQCLADTLQQCLQNGKVTSDFYKEGSPLMHHEQSSRLVAILYELNEVHFDLSPQGTNLDMGWPTFSRKVFGGGASAWSPPSRTLSMSSLFSLSSQQPDLSQSFGTSSPDEQRLPESHAQSSDIESAIHGIVAKIDELNANQCEANELTKELALNAGHHFSGSYSNPEGSSRAPVDGVDVSWMENREADLRDRLMAMERAADEHARQLEAVAERQALREQLFRDREREMELQVAALERRNEDLSEEVQELRSLKPEMESGATNQAKQTEEGNTPPQVMDEDREAKYKKAIAALKEKLEIKDRVNGHLERQVAALKEVSAAVKGMMDVRTSEVQSLRTIVSELKAAHAAAPPPSEERLRAEVLETEKAALEKRVAELQHNADNHRRDADATAAMLRERESELESMRKRLATLETDAAESREAVTTLSQRLTTTESERNSLTQQLDEVNKLMHRVEMAEEELEKVDATSEIPVEFVHGQNHLEASEEAAIDVSDLEGDRPRPVGSDNVESQSSIRSDDHVVQSVHVPHDFPLARRALVRLQRLLLEKRSPSVLPFCRVHKHECQLSSVTSELRATKSLVEKLSNAHKRLQTSDAILRYELREKRVFVERMKEQLESAANMRLRVRQKHSESELEWQSLRAEFASRHKQDSEESGRGSSEAVTAASASASSSAGTSREKSEERDSLDGASCSSVSSSSAIVYSSVSPDLPAATSETEEDERPSDTPVHRRRTDVRLELMEEQCRLLYCSLLSSMKKSEVLHYKLSKLHDNHSGGTPRGDEIEIATLPEVERPAVTPPLSPTVDEPSSCDSLGDGQGGSTEDDLSVVESTSGLGLDDSVDVLKMDEEVDGIKIEIDVDALKMDDGKLVAKLDALLVAQSLPKRVEVLRRKKEDLEREVLQLTENCDDGLVREARLRARLEKAGTATAVRESVISQLEAERDLLKTERVELKEELARLKECLQQRITNLELQLKQALAGQEDLEVVLQARLEAGRESWNSAKVELEDELVRQRECSERRIAELEVLLEQTSAGRDQSVAEVHNQLVIEQESWNTALAKLEQQHNRQFLEMESHLEQELAERNKSVAELRTNLERATEELDQVRRSMQQEVTALRFQLSMESMRNEEVVKRHSECEGEIGEAHERVNHQERLIADLESQLENVVAESQRKKLQADAAVEQLNVSLATAEKELEVKGGQLQDATGKLNETEGANASLVVSLDESREELSRLSGELDELRSLKDDMHRKIIKLIKEKDLLWRRGEQLSFIRKVQSADRWLKDEEVSHCMNCNAEFSIVVRKHHCRICGRIFCFGCCNHWATTAAHSGRVRVCNDCVVGYSQVDPTLGESDGDEETNIFSNEPGSSIAGPSSDNLTVGGSDGVSVASSLESTLNVSAHSDSTTFSDDKDKPAEPQEGVSLLGRLLASWSSPKPAAILDESDEDFHVIGDEEITKSLSHSGPYMLKAEGDDSIVQICPLMSAEELESEFADGAAREVWINAGKAYGMPIAIKGRITLLWEFSTEPKNIAFSLVYHFDASPENVSSTSLAGFLSSCPTRVLVPITHCDSHLHAVRGKLVVRNPGIYTFYFGNDFSRFTSKKLKFIAQIQRKEVSPVCQNTDSTSPSSTPEQDSITNEISG